jgi:hypothetical protein
MTKTARTTPMADGVSIDKLRASSTRESLCNRDSHNKKPDEAERVSPEGKRLF